MRVAYPARTGLLEWPLARLTCACVSCQCSVPLRFVLLLLPPAGDHCYVQDCAGWRPAGRCLAVLEWVVRERGCYLHRAVSRPAACAQRTQAGLSVLQSTAGARHYANQRSGKRGRAPLFWLVLPLHIKAQDELTRFARRLQALRRCDEVLAHGCDELRCASVLDTPAEGENTVRRWHQKCGGWAAGCGGVL